MRFILLIILFLSSSLFGQDASSKIYWNSLATAVNIGVPLEDDETLKGGRIQIRVSLCFHKVAHPADGEDNETRQLMHIRIPAFP